MSNAEKVLAEGWGGDLTNETVGKILCLGSWLGEPSYSQAIDFIKYCPREADIKAFIEEMEDIINLHEQEETENEA